MSIRDQVRLGTIDEGWAIHTDGGLRYGGQDFGSPSSRF